MSFFVKSPDSDFMKKLQELGGKKVDLNFQIAENSLSQKIEKIAVTIVEMFTRPFPRFFIDIFNNSIPKIIYLNKNSPIFADEIELKEGEKEEIEKVLSVNEKNNSI